MQQWWRTAFLRCSLKVPVVAAIYSLKPCISTNTINKQRNRWKTSPGSDRWSCFSCIRFRFSSDRQSATRLANRIKTKLREALQNEILEICGNNDKATPKKEKKLSAPNVRRRRNSVTVVWSERLFQLDLRMCVHTIQLSEHRHYAFPGIEPTRNRSSDSWSVTER